MKFVKAIEISYKFKNLFLKVLSDKISAVHDVRSNFAVHYYTYP